MPKFTTQQVLNILTGTLHTSVDDVYKFFDQVIEPGIMTHMLPNAVLAIQPILQSKFPDLPTKGFHPDYPNSEVDVELTPEERQRFWEAYLGLPHPFNNLKE